MPLNNEYPKVIEAERPYILEQIIKAKAISDYTLLLVHGGDEMVPYPNPKFRSLCESFIDSGADVVITHHPHVLGGVHSYKNKYIFYSLGDFIFDGESYLRRRGLVVSIRFDEDNISYNILPTHIKMDLSVGLAKNNQKNIIIRKWYKVSKILQFDSNYKLQYKRRYILSFFFFQFDRLNFLIKNKGFIYFTKFILKKIKLLPYYFMKIVSKNFV